MADALTWIGFLGLLAIGLLLIHRNTRGPGGGRPA